MEIIHLSFVFLLNVILSGTVECCSFGGNTKPEVEQGGVSLFASDTKLANWKKEVQFNGFCGDSGTQETQGKPFGEFRSLPSEFPWMVLLLITLKDKKGSIISCSGQIISKKHILTAGHCVEDAKFVTAIVGNLYEKAPISPQHKLQVKKIFLHNDYQKITSFQTTLAKHDLAILEMQKELKTTDPQIGIACLPQVNYDFSHQNFQVGKSPVMVLGHGTLFNESKSACCLRRAKGLRALSRRDCLGSILQGRFSSPEMKFIVENALSKGSLCCGWEFGSPITSCIGTGGGGLYYLSSDSKYVLLSVISFRPRSDQNCDTHSTFVGSDIRHYMDWIFSVLQSSQ